MFILDFLVEESIFFLSTGIPTKLHTLGLWVEGDSSVHENNEPQSFIFCSIFLLLKYLVVDSKYLTNCLYLQSHSFTFLVILTLSLVMGIVLNFTMFLCTIVNSALTTTIVGVLKGVGSTVCVDYPLEALLSFKSLSML